MYINKAMIYGNLTRDPELRAMPNGNQVCSFAVATNRNYKDGDGNRQEQVEYHDVVAFGKLADIMGQYLKKGRPVYVEGRLQTRSWEQDGVKRYRTEIIADNMIMLDSKGMGGGSFGGDSGSPVPPPPPAPPADDEIRVEDIPF